MSNTFHVELLDGVVWDQTRSTWSNSWLMLLSHQLLQLTRCFILFVAAYCPTPEMHTVAGSLGLYLLLLLLV